MSEVVTFMPDAGGSIVSKNILSHKGKLRWCVRENLHVTMALTRGCEEMKNSHNT